MMSAESGSPKNCELCFSKMSSCCCCEEQQQQLLVDGFSDKPTCSAAAGNRNFFENVLGTDGVQKAMLSAPTRKKQKNGTLEFPSLHQTPVSTPTFTGNGPASGMDNGRISDKSFNSRLQAVRLWFSECNEERKNCILKDILAECRQRQFQFLFSLLEPKFFGGDVLFESTDPFATLPADLVLNILSFLEPRELCTVSKVCRLWRKIASEPCLWKRLCHSPRLYRMSSLAAEKRHLDSFLTPDGNVKWKEAFAERYRLWRNWIKGRCVVRTFEGHSQGISCVQFDRDRIVSGSSDNTIRLWDMRTNSRWATMTLTGHSATVRCLQLDGNRLASGSNDYTIKVWDLSVNPTWSSIACRVTMVGHTNNVRCIQMDMEKIISGSYDKTLKIWDMTNGECKMTLSGHDEAVLCLQYDDRKIISGSADNTIKIWDQNSGQCVLTLHNAHQNAVTCLQFDDNWIVSGSLDRTIKFWDVRTGRWLQTLDWMQGEGHTGVVRCLQADSWRIVSAADDKTLKVWNLHTGKRINTLKSHTDGVTCVQFDDFKIVSGSYDKTVKLWDFSIG